MRPLAFIMFMFVITVVTASGQWSCAVTETSTRPWSDLSADDSLACVAALAPPNWKDSLLVLSTVLCTSVDTAGEGEKSVVELVTRCRAPLLWLVKYDGGQESGFLPESKSRTELDSDAGGCRLRVDVPPTARSSITIYAITTTLDDIPTAHIIPTHRLAGDAIVDRHLAAISVSPTASSSKKIATSASPTSSLKGGSVSPSKTPSGKAGASVSPSPSTVKSASVSPTRAAASASVSITRSKGTSTSVSPSKGSSASVTSSKSITPAASVSTSPPASSSSKASASKSAGASASSTPAISPSSAASPSHLAPGASPSSSSSPTPLAVATSTGSSPSLSASTSHSASSGLGGNTHSSSLSTGATVGIVVGIACAGVAVVAGVYLFLSHRSKQSSKSISKPMLKPPPPLSPKSPSSSPRPPPTPTSPLSSLSPMFAAGGVKSRTLAMLGGGDGGEGKSITPPPELEMHEPIVTKRSQPGSSAAPTPTAVAKPLSSDSDSESSDDSKPAHKTAVVSEAPITRVPTHQSTSRVVMDGGIMRHNIVTRVSGGTSGSTSSSKGSASTRTEAKARLINDRQTPQPQLPSASKGSDAVKLTRYNSSDMTDDGMLDIATPAITLNGSSPLPDSKHRASRQSQPREPSRSVDDDNDTPVSLDELFDLDNGSPTGDAVATGKLSPRHRSSSSPRASPKPSGIQPVSLSSRHSRSKPKQTSAKEAPSKPKAPLIPRHSSSGDELDANPDTIDVIGDISAKALDWKKERSEIMHMMRKLKKKLLRAREEKERGREKEERRERHRSKSKGKPRQSPSDDVFAEKPRDRERFSPRALLAEELKGAGADTVLGYERVVAEELEDRHRRATQEARKLERRISQQQQSAHIGETSYPFSYPPLQQPIPMQPYAMMSQPAQPFPAMMQPQPYSMIQESPAVQRGAVKPIPIRLSSSKASEPALSSPRLSRPTVAEGVMSSAVLQQQPQPTPQWLVVPMNDSAMLQAQQGAGPSVVMSAMPTSRMPGPAPFTYGGVQPTVLTAPAPSYLPQPMATGNSFVAPQPYPTQGLTFGTLSTAPPQHPAQFPITVASAGTGSAPQLAPVHFSVPPSAPAPVSFEMTEPLFTQPKTRKTKWY